MTPSPRKATVNRSIPALVLVGALALGGALVAAPAQAASQHSTYYSVPFSGDLYATFEPEGIPTVGRATFDEWAADGFPKPVPAEIAYRSYTWSPTIYVDVRTEAAAASVALTYGEWRTAGSPRPTDDRIAVDGDAYRFGYSSEVFVSQGDIDGGYPVNHKLTFSEFTHLGSPTPDVYSYTFRKLSWLPSIVGPAKETGEDQALDFASWDYWARPTPQIVKSFDGDRFCKAAGSADIRYVGIAAPKGVKLTFGQWREAGSPAPARC
jgi:hypothetical protein